MPLLMSLSQDEKLGLQYQVFEQLRSMILGGSLQCGAKLPATRHLSETLGVSRNTVALAYARLTDEGYIETRESVGTFVSSHIPDSALLAATVPPKAQRHRDGGHSPANSSFMVDVRPLTLVNPHTRRLIADFWVGRPDAKSFPIKTWSKLISRRLLSAGPALTEYKDPAGFIDLRQAIADHLRPARGITTSADQIIIVGGCQDGLNLVCRMMLSKGNAAVIETPCYQGAAYLFESFGAKIHAVPVDKKGLVTSRLPEIPNTIAYVTPSHQYPMGVTLSLDRRLELLAWAARTNSYILEDDYDSDFRFKGPPVAALKGLDRLGRVIYLGTFSKCMGAGLRIGYAVLPAGLEEKARRFKTIMNNGQPWLEQAALADFMTSGSYASHLRRIRRLYLARRNALVESLRRHFGTGEVLGDEAGMHLVWRLPDHLPPAHKVEEIALSAGIGVYTVSSGGAAHFGPTGNSDRFLVLGFSSLSEKEIELGISRLADALEEASSIKPLEPQFQRRVTSVAGPNNKRVTVT
jgi:GntR family transcriptional regulator / MocR family aminotransferase